MSHPWIGAIRGGLHGKDYVVFDDDMAYIRPAQMMAMAIIDLLFDDASQADEMLADYTPLMSKEEYLSFIGSFKN
ncbi:hypothetical protein AB7Z36_13035 [Providencia rettgeri]